MDLNLIEQIGNDKSALTKSARTVNTDAVPRYNGGFIPANPEEVAAQKPYDPKEAMKVMNDNIAHRRANASRIPDVIKESIMSNPLLLEGDGSSEIDSFTDRLSQKLSGMEGIRRSMGILEQAESIDRDKQTERMITERTDNTTPKRASGGVDYEIIKAIVENAIDKKLSQFKQTLNESVGREQPQAGLSVMKLGSKFLFLDSDDNIYECEMKYKGKNKKRK